LSHEYTSSELFHFVGRADPNNHDRNFQTLKSVLESRCVTYSPNDLSWGPVRHEVNWERSLLDESLVIPTITCYADIPKESLKIHMKKYGYFGLSIDRGYLVENYVRPVTYIPIYTADMLGISGRTLLKDIEAVCKGYEKHLRSNRSNEQRNNPRSLGSIPIDADETIDALSGTLLKDFLGFIKPFNSELDIGHPDNFYLEREWRKLGNIKFDDNHVGTVVIEEHYKEKSLQIFPQFETKLMTVEPGT
jgi:hypothetical protein